MADDINLVGEEENDSKGTADVVDSWVASMMEKLGPNHCKFSPFTICKVHTDIRKDDPGAYTPKIVSIGPFHRRDKNVQAMEELKRYYLNNILPSDDGEKERHLKKYLEEMKKIEPRVRSSYSEKIDMNPKDFVEMMVVDGFFLIQLLFQEQHEIKKEDPIYNNYWRLPLISQDILLLENQLPFFVLERLCRLIGGNYEEDLWKRALNFYEHLFTKEDDVERKKPEEDDVERKKPKEDVVERKKPEIIYHLLHLMHIFFNPAASAPSGQQSPREAPQISGAAQSTVCVSASISALNMGCRSPTPPGEQSSQEIEYTPSRQQSSLEVPLIYASTLRGSAPTYSITTDCMPPTPPGEQSAQELQHTLSGEQSSLKAHIRSGNNRLGSAPINPRTRPPASQGKQSLQELKHSPSSNIFPEWSGSSLIISGSAPINPKTKVRSPPGLPGKQSSKGLQHTESGQQSFEYVPLKSSIAEPFFCSSAVAHHVTPPLWHPIPPGQQSFEDPSMSTSAHADPATTDLGPFVGASGNNPPTKKTIPSATELQAAGVTFQLKKTNNFLDVTFIKQGKLEMPCLRIDDATNSLFRNFIAFEQCFPCCGSYFTSYCFFMDSLVNTAKDVQILSRVDVIENLLGSDGEVALLFNKLCRGVSINFEDSYLAKKFKNINQHTKKMWPKYRAKLMRDYFSNPWSTLSVAAASLIIVLTIVQTFFTIFAYFIPSES